MFEVIDGGKINEVDFAVAIKNAGGSAYRVGGSIRNQLIGIPVNDYDYCVTGLSEEAFLQLFPDAEKVGISFPVFLLDINEEKCEVAFARKEKKVGVGHKGFEIDCDVSITIEDDLARRDFTMNAMAYDILDNQVIDPFGGRQDIKDGVIRALSESFKEDPLRVYRAARFASQLEFTIAHATVEMFQDASLQEDMKTLSPERIYVELKKALVSEHPARFFYYLSKGNCLGVHFKEVEALIGVEQHPEHHPEGDAYAHTMKVLIKMCELTDRVEVRFAALCHDLGKAKTPKELWPAHHGHEQAGLEPVEDLCNRLKLPKKWREAAGFGTENHMRFHRFHEMKPVKKVDLIENARKSALGVEGFALLCLADVLGRDGLHERHPNYQIFIDFAHLISQVKGNKELQGLKAYQDKRSRQAFLIRKQTD